MKVLHVITGLGVGGAEHQLRLLLRHLPHECEVATLTNPGPVADAIRAGGTTVHEMGMRGNRDVSVVPRLARLMRSGRFDLVHTHLYRAGVHGRLAARLARVPRVVATEHSLNEGVIEGRATTRGVRALYLAAERLGDTTVAVSDTVAGRLVAWGVPRRRIRVIPNGIDTAEVAFDAALRRAARERLGIPAGTKVVGAIGRLEPTKRFDQLILAVRDLPEVALLLVGDGSARASLEALARDAGIAGRVVFAGSTPYPRDVLCAMDVFASPSDRETFGLAVLEALACGLPVVYAACPPLEELGADAAPAASRTASDRAALREALRTELARLDERGDGRLPLPPAVGHYDITRLARAVATLYEHPAGRRRPVALHRPAESEGS
jgi:glycosyltransferase involved in cell wall biosynthesis